MKVCSSWAVAVVFLLEEDSAASFEKITNYIIGTDLTLLGEDGSTPEKTVRSILGSTRKLIRYMKCWSVRKQNNEGGMLTRSLSMSWVTDHAYTAARRKHATQASSVRALRAV